MTNEILLGRRLIEALVDPDTSREASDGAGVEFAELCARFGVKAGHPLPIETFEGLEADDLSPAAWLYLLENRPREEPEIPISILHDLFMENIDPAVRFRLIRGALSQPRAREVHLEALTGVSLRDLPESFPKYQIDWLTRSSFDEDERGQESASAALVEIALYLLQDGSYAALTLAAAAITPQDDWRRPARTVVHATVQTVDPESHYAMPFRDVPFERPL